MYSPADPYARCGASAYGANASQPSAPHTRSKKRGLDTASESASKKLRTIANELDTAAAKTPSLKDDLIKAQRERDAFGAENLDLEEENSELKVDNNRLEEDNKILEENNKNLKEDNKNLKEDNGALMAKLEKVKKGWKAFNDVGKMLDGQL